MKRSGLITVVAVTCLIAGWEVAQYRRSILAMFTTETAPAKDPRAFPTTVDYAAPSPDLAAADMPLEGPATLQDVEEAAFAVNQMVPFDKGGYTVTGARADGLILTMFMESQDVLSSASEAELSDQMSSRMCQENPALANKILASGIVYQYVISDGVTEKTLTSTGLC